MTRIRRHHHSVLRQVCIILCSCCLTSSWISERLGCQCSNIWTLRRDLTQRLGLALSSSSGGGSSGAGRRSLSAAEQARREEEQSRRQRAGDVVIGKTSALPEAKDYAVDPSATELEYLRQATRVEQIVHKQTERGLEALKMLRIDDAIESFDAVFEIKPTAYLWQAGIAKFYAGDLEGAADIFARSAITFEAKFGGPASEERIWRHACELKLIDSMSRKDRKLVEETGGVGSLLTPIPFTDNTAALLRSENRKVIRIIRDLFSSSVEKDYTGVILSRAQLRSIGGKPRQNRPVMDRKLWKINSLYYLGLHYDTMGNMEESKKCMKMALTLCPSSGNGMDIVHSLPFIHMSQREWFDDDEFDEEDTIRPVDPSSATRVSLTGNAVVVDPIVAESIMSGIDELHTLDLQKALRLRGLTTTGSKQELQSRLFESLVEDARLFR